MYQAVRRKSLKERVADRAGDVVTHMGYPLIMCVIAFLPQILEPRPTTSMRKWGAFYGATGSVCGILCALGVARGSAQLAVGAAIAYGAVYLLCIRWARNL